MPTAEPLLFNLQSSICNLKWLLLLTVLLCGCTSNRARPAGFRPVPILAQYPGNDAALRDPIVQLIRSRAELEAMGAPSLLELKVDFAVHYMLLVTLGEKPTSGWWVRVDHVQRNNRELYFQGVANAPGPKQVTGQVLTYPYTAVLIPRVGDLKVRAEIESVKGQSAD